MRSPGHRGKGVNLYEYQPTTRDCPRCETECFLPDYGTVVCGACGWRPGDPPEEYRRRRRRRGTIRTEFDRRIDADLILMRNANYTLGQYRKDAIVDEHIELIKTEVKKQVKAEIERVRRLKPVKPKALAPGQTVINDDSYLLIGMYAKPEYVDVAAEMKEWELAIPEGENDRSHITERREL